MTRLRLGLALGVLAVLGLVAVGLSRYLDEGGTHTVLPPPSARPYASLILLTADAHGAVAELSRHTIAGFVRGRAAPVWREPFVPWPLCLDQCPDAVLSGSLETAGQPDRADPPVRWITRGTVTRTAAGVPGHGVGKTEVFGVLDRTTYVAQDSALDGTNQVDLVSPAGSVTMKLPSATFPNIVVNSSVTAAFVLRQPTDATPGAVTWFQRDATGWHRRFSGPTKAMSGCISADGRHAVLLGDGAQLLDLAAGNGHATRSVPARDAGGCAFSATGPVLVDNYTQGSSLHTEIYQFTLAGRLVWKAGIEGSGLVSASTRQSQVAVATTDTKTLTVLDRHGHPTLVPHAVSGLIVGRQLVWLGPDKHVHWARRPW